MEQGHAAVAPRDVFLGIGVLAFYAVVVAVIVIPFWMIWKRTGHSGAWGLLALVPLANVIALWALAFKKWPAVDGREPKP